MRKEELTKGEKKLTKYIMQRMLEIMEEDLPPLVVADKLEQISLACDRLVEMMEEHVVVEGEPDEMMCEAITQALMDGLGMAQ